jgi:hypothetical protein
MEREGIHHVESWERNDKPYADQLSRRPGSPFSQTRGVKTMNPFRGQVGTQLDASKVKCQIDREALHTAIDAWAHSLATDVGFEDGSMAYRHLFHVVSDRVLAPNFEAEHVVREGAWPKH